MTRYLKSLKILKEYIFLIKPINEEVKKQIKDEAEKIISEYPKYKQKTEMSNKDFEKWVDESNKIAKEFVYKNIKQNDTPTEAYITEGKKIIRKRMALAGYRMAELLTNIYESYNPDAKLANQKTNNPAVKVNKDKSPATNNAKENSNKNKSESKAEDSAMKKKAENSKIMRKKLI